MKWYGQGADKGDKGAYKAETGAVKYMLLKTFLIPTGDDPEHDDTPPPQNGKKQTPAAKPESAPSVPNGNVATAEQQEQIKTLAKELGISVQNDILPKLRIGWPPDKPNADKIIKRLLEIKQQTPTNGHK